MSHATNTTLDTLPEAEVRQLARELVDENRRLRKILTTLAKAGEGRGAVFEVTQTPDAFGIVVCRADRDEAAFAKDAEFALDRLSRALEHFASTCSGEPVDLDRTETRQGSTREDLGSDR
jgi:hypothetical protein